MLYTPDPWKMCGLGVPTICTVECLSITDGRHPIHAVPSHPWFHICRFNQLQWCSIVVFTIEKNPHISGPMQFKSMLFKGQLYCMTPFIWRSGKGKTEGEICGFWGFGVRKEDWVERGTWKLRLFLFLYRKYSIFSLW